MNKKHCLTGRRSRTVLARACAGVAFQPLESRTLLATAGLALDWGGVDTAYEVAVDGRGRIVVTGDSDDALIMARFTRSGDALDLDESFGTEGSVALDFEPYGIEIQPDGKILLVGDDAEGTLLVARYDDNGTLDTAFAGDGTAEFNLVPGVIGNAVELQPDGKIVAAGATLTPAGHNDFVVVRFARNGTLDTSFGDGGFVTTDFNDGGDDVANGLGVLHDGRIAVGGASDVGDELNYAVARYMPNGTLDPSLDGEGGDGNGRVSGPFEDGDGLDDLPVTDFIVFPGGRMSLIGHGVDDPGITDDGVIYPLAADGTLDRNGIFYLTRSGPHDEMDIQGYEWTFASTWHDESTATEDDHNHDFSPGYDFGGDDLNGLEFDEYVMGVAVRDGKFAAVGYSGDDWAMTLSDGSAVQGSYTGAVHQPGQTIQAEEFDFGGEGAAYHDADVVNRGGEYRVGGVDIGYTADTGGGFAVGWTQAGEWLEYTIDVPETGTYRFETRLANPAGGATFHYEINGAEVTGRTSVPATGGWHTFATVQSGIVNLTAGQHVLRLAMDSNASNGAIGNVNWLRFTQIHDGGGEPGEGGGQPDTTFGGDGVVDSASGDSVRPVDAAIGPNGEVVAVGGSLIARHLADGSFDENFGTGGVVETDFTQIHDVAIQPDGKVVVVGHQNNVFRIARYTTAGQRDTKFSGDGIVTRSFGGTGGADVARAVAIQPDGRMVVVGAGRMASSGTDRVLIVTRFTPSGAVDSTFDGDGYSAEFLRAGSDIAYDVAIASDGDIVVGGGSGGSGVLLRYLRGGALDTSFSGDGIAYLDDEDFVTSVGVQDDGKVVWAAQRTLVVGDIFWDVPVGIVGRLNENGTVDTTFGQGGTTSPTGLFRSADEDDQRYTFAHDLAIDDGGNIIVVGQQEEDQGARSFAVMTALRPDGSVHDAFDGGGRGYTYLPVDPRSAAEAVAVGSDGSIVVASEHESSQIVLSRFLPLDDDGGGTPTDTQKPATPGNLRAQASHDRVVLNWDASSDNVGVVSYEIRRNDVRIATVGANQTSYTDTNVLPDEGYGYDVIAIDAAGNRSDEAFVNIMTPDAPQQGNGLQGVYYSNIDFTGTSVARTDAGVNFDWGTGGPAATIGTDTFSARWTGQVQAEKTERYTFYTNTDDGVRLWVNGQLLIDKWVPQKETEWSGSINLVAGQRYDIKMDYFERFGQAVAELRWSSPTTPKQVIPTSRLFVAGSETPTDTQKPTAPTNLRATPQDRGVVLDWNPAFDNVGVASYEIFRDGERVATLLGDELNYVEAGLESETRYTYDVVAVDAAGNRSDPASVQTVTLPEPVSGGLQGIFYHNMDFTGEAMRRRDLVVDYNWDRGSPDPSIQPDTFSVRFFGRIKPTKTERYTFYTRSDDGVRLRVNGVTLIDKLVPQSETEWSGSIDLVAGREYSIELDYFERFGQAKVQLFWSSPTTPKQIVPPTHLGPESLM